MSIKSNLKVGLVVLALGSGSAALAADPLACPKGTAEAKITDKGGVVNSFCQMTRPDGTKVSHGPFVIRNGRGIVVAQGQTEDGKRTGTWLHFDDAGVKTTETQFLAGDYHGVRKEFHPNGKVKLQETFKNGVKVGETQTFDLTGKLVVTAAK